MPKLHARLLLLACGFALAISGCATISALSGELEYHHITLVVTAKNPIAVYRRGPDGKPADSIGLVRPGDTLHSAASATRSSGFMQNQIVYLIKHRSDSALVVTEGGQTGRDITPAWWMQATTFMLPATAGPQAWERAQYYIANHSTYHVSVTDNVITTELTDYERVNKPSNYYKVSRIRKGSAYEYAVIAGSGRNDQRFAFYIATGEDN